MNRNIFKILRRIIYENGVRIVNNIERLEGYLKSDCPTLTKEINAIILGCIEKIPDEIIRLNIKSSDTQIKNELVRRLEKNLPVELSWVEWIVEAWLFALDNNPVSNEGLYETSEPVEIKAAKTTVLMKESSKFDDIEGFDQKENPVCYGYITTIDDSIYYSNSFNYGKLFRVNLIKSHGDLPRKNYYIYYPNNWNYSVKCTDNNTLYTRLWQ